VSSSRILTISREIHEIGNSEMF
jgi:hypothetical protein